MVTDDEAARARAEKNRMDPPPDGKEWSLGWTQDGRREPARDMLVTIEQPPAAPGAQYGLSYTFEEDQPGYTYPVSGPGVRNDLIQAGVARLAGLLGVDDLAKIDEAATDVLKSAGSGHLMEARSLVRIVVSAALEKLHAEHDAAQG